jgi:RHS repeat-associated protein
LCTTWSYGDSALNSDCSIAYAYDSNGRLSRVDTASGALRRTDYAHDKGGNRTSVAYRALPTDANPAASDTYTRTAGTNRLASITTAAGTRTISYDARGNTASETRPAGVSVSTSYDGYGRLTGYTRTGDPTQTNVYNGLDDRVAVTSGGTTRRYVFDADGRVMGEYGTSASDVIAEFIWLNPEVGDGSAFGGDDGVGGYAPLAVASGPVATPTLLWVHGNHLGVPQVYTTSSGALASPGAWQLPGFPGQSRTLADLYYNRYRDYDPSTGRYIQSDPIGLAGDTNSYVYAGANPVTGVDPQGLQQRPGIGHNSGDPNPFGRETVTPSAWDILKRLVRVGAVAGVIVGDIFFPEPLADGTLKSCPPAQSPVWRGLKPYRGPYKTDGKYVYKYDRLHNDIEVFNQRGVHVGSVNPITGKLIKDPVQGRRESF